MIMDFQIKALNQNEVEIYLYGAIETWSMVSAKEIISQIRALKSRMYNHIILRIHSPGGDVLEGFAIYDYIKAEKDLRFTAQIDGIAASMMSIVMLAAGTIKMNKYARIMTHNPSAYGQGNEEQLAAVVKLLQDVKDDMANIYAKKTGIDKQEIIEKWLGNADHWVGSAKALEIGLVDEVVDDEPQMRDLQLDNLADFKIAAAMYDKILSDTFKTNEYMKSEIYNKTVLPVLLLAMGEMAANLGEDEQRAEAIRKAIEKGLAAEKELQELKAALMKQKAEDLKDLVKDYPEGIQKIASTLLGEGKMKELSELLDGLKSVTFASADAGKKEEIPLLTQLSLRDQVLSKQIGNTQEETREAWTYRDWEENDPQGLFAMMEKEPKRFELLVSSYKSNGLTTKKTA
ncbi:MAG TPA: hypothetical protein DCM08_05905 [Microscillaceae bacterium]|jgi:ATP-dependent protease ClpP protease subunit|nr:hypothetical protein [Microscillaceae bacterium]